jgi:hypothetical protein
LKARAALLGHSGRGDDCRKMRCTMIIDIKREYDDYIRDAWKNLWDENNDLMASGERLEDMYDNILLCLIQFLIAKLEILEEQNS